MSPALVVACVEFVGILILAALAWHREAFCIHGCSTCDKRKQEIKDKAHDENVRWLGHCVEKDCRRHKKRVD